MISRMSTHIWLRAETKAGEARRALAPEDVRTLIDAGFQVTVECSHQSAIPDQEYAEAGCHLVEAGQWQRAPEHAYILGLKELPELPESISGRHIYFAHAYKQQQGWQSLLSRFRRGDGELLDLEYLVDDADRRLAAFGYWAGYVGAALGVLAWANQQRGVAPALKPLAPWNNRSALLAELRSAIDDPIVKVQSPKLMIIGAGGRVGSGARALADNLEIQHTDWDMAETAAGGPFAEILSHDILVNCVLVSEAMPPFLTPDMLDAPERLQVIADVSCDPYGDYNPLPLYQRCTTLQQPLISLGDGRQPLDLIAIDHLPVLLPRESSEDYSRQLLPVLLGLNEPGNRIWERARTLYHQHSRAAS